MPRHFSELIWMGGGFCRGPPRWFWRSRHEKPYVPRGYDLPATRKQAAQPMLVRVHSPGEIFFPRKKRVCKFTNMLLRLKKFLAQHDTATNFNCENNYWNSLSSDAIFQLTQICFSQIDAAFLIWITFLFRQWAGWPLPRPHAEKCFMWPSQFSAAESRPEDGSHQK